MSGDEEDPNNLGFHQIDFSAPPAKKSKSNVNFNDECETQNKCYFEKCRKTVHESKERPPISVVSSVCAGGLTSFLELINSTQNQFGVRNEAEIVLARGAGEFEYDWDNPEYFNEVSKRSICLHHRNELSTSWAKVEGHIQKPQRRIACSLPHGLGLTHESYFFGKTYDVTHSEAMTLLHNTGVLIHVGIPVCKKHQDFIRSLLNKKEEPRPKMCTADSNIFDNYEETTPRSSRSKVNYRETPERSIKDNEPKTPPKENPYFFKQPSPFGEVANDYYRLLMKELAVTPYTANTSWKKMSKRNKNRHIAAFKDAINKLAVLAVGVEDAPLLLQASTPLLDSECDEVGFGESENECLKEVSKMYYAADSPQDRRRVLSVVADVFPIRNVEKYIPGLTSWSYYQAKKDAIRFKNCQKKAEIAILKPRVKRSDIVSFIDFVCGENVTIGLPFGITHAKLPNGSTIDIPSAIRAFRATEIITMYTTEMRNQKLPVGISDMTMRRILEACPAKTKTTLDAVDQYKAYGLQAFEWLSGLTQSLLNAEVISASDKTTYKAQLTEAEFFLKADYYNLLQLEHLAPEFCLNYALSDKQMKEFRSDLCHLQEDHTYSIPRAHIFDGIIRAFQNDIAEFAKKAENATAVLQFEAILEECKKAINNWRDHIVRKRFSDIIRVDIFHNLENGDAFITIDYAQKFLPRKSAESMSEYFGKAGLSMHVMHVVFKTSSEVVQHTVVHFLGHAEQDFVAVTAILISGLKVLAAHNVVNVTIRSDNAGYYHNAAMLMSIPKIAKEAGVNIKRYSFSEAQAGKSTADVETARLKNTMRGYLKSGGNILSEYDMYRAIDEAIQKNTLLGVTAIVPAKIPDSNNASSKKLDHMSFVGDVEFATCGDDFLMRYWKHYGIGPGIERRLTVDDYEDLPIEQFSGNPWITSTTPFWRGSSVSTKSSNQRNVEVVEEGGNAMNEGLGGEGLYRCDHEGCVKEFITSAYLQRHMLTGDHELAPERETLQETAYKLYADTMSGLREAHRSIISTVITSEPTVNNGQVFPAEGWALKKPAKRTRYSENVKKFLREQYVKQMRQGRKRVNAYIVQEEMRNSTTPLFPAEQRLSQAQIASWYTRYAAEMKKLLDTMPSEEPTDAQAREIASITSSAMDNEAGAEFQFRQNPQYSEDYNAVRTVLNTENGIVTYADEE